MKQLTKIASLNVMFASLLLCSGQASALPTFGSNLNAAYPGKNLYTGSCLVCHDSANDDPSWFSQYGRILQSQGADDDFLSITPMITSAGMLDFDLDGFTVNQEIEGGSFAGGSLIGTPTLAGSTAGGAVSATSSNANINALTASVSTSPYTTVAAGHKNIGGTVVYTLSNFAAGSASITLLFNSGGIQSAATVQFIDNYSAASLAIPATGDADSTGWSANADGSITIHVTDDGIYDLYSGVVGSLGVIQTSLAITTTTPPTGILPAGFGDNEDGEGSEGGLHCMATDMNSQGLMFLALLAIGLFIRRKSI